jgi:hypothetical protein
VRKQKTTYITRLERHSAIGSQVRAFPSERLGIARQDGRLGPQAKQVVDETKALNQPASEKTSATRDE